MTVPSSSVHVSRIEIFPIKSLGALRLAKARVNDGGILEGDRVYAMFDVAGEVVNGKRTPRVHQLGCEYAADGREISVWESGHTAHHQFSVTERGPLERWLGEFFGFPVSLREQPRSGFPDDTEASGPTVVSEASLEAVRAWYPTLTLEDVRRRFRTNLELSGGAAFCEDALFGAPGERKPFRLGAVTLLGHNPCQRCVVPTRDPETGEVIAGFQKSFAAHRRRHLPAWADTRRFNHFYRFALNTSIPTTEAGKQLAVGDPLLTM